ncbi:M35 family metallo-endopeptidase [Paraherbaspirillum soli]|uniref:M35 family metallo-endopeptidase n=1 Tax=Paraherbaspirillum soli TaxID=631222 RepID=A0ABW0MD87_9BURK
MPEPIHTGPDGRKYRHVATVSTTPTTDTSVKVITVYPETVCPNMTNEEFAETVMRLRDEAVVRTVMRIDGLSRWGANDRKEVVQWFGSDSEEVRSTLLEGLPQINRVLSSLTPSNFVRWSKVALSYLNCDGSKGDHNTTAAVCKPDVATHKIAIGLNFCEMPDDRKNFDTGEPFNGDSKLLTLVHEISHFNDTMNSVDSWYSTKISQDRAFEGNKLCIGNADNIAGYVVFARRGK